VVELSCGVEVILTSGGASAASYLIYIRADLARNVTFNHRISLIQTYIRIRTSNSQRDFQIITRMDILYETVSLPKPEKRKKSQSQKNQKYSGLKMNGEKK